MFVHHLFSMVGLVALSAQAAEFTNPIRKSGPDPFIVYDNDTSSYYLQTSTGSDLRIVSATTLGGLTDGKDTRMYQDSSMTTNQTVWAPELHKIDGTWYIYFAHEQRPWVIEGGSSPLDTFAGPPIQLSTSFGIDGSILTVSGTNYFVWSCQSTLSGKGLVSSICISTLTTPTSIDTDNIKVLSQPTESWEEDGGNINEAPQALYWDNEIYMTYSASHCKTAGYSLGLLHLTGSDPLEPSSWTKKTDGPVFSSGNGEYGPGHNGIFLSPDGTELWNVYHAVTNANGSCGTDRQTFAEMIDLSNFTTSGPNFGTPAAQGSTAQGPSGEDGPSSASSSSSSASSVASSTVKSLTSLTSSDPQSQSSSSTNSQASTSGSSSPATSILTSTSTTPTLTSTVTIASSSSLSASSSITPTSSGSGSGGHSHSHSHSGGQTGNRGPGGGQALIAVTGSSTASASSTSSTSPASGSTASSNCPAKRGQGGRSRRARSASEAERERAA